AVPKAHAKQEQSELADKWINIAAHRYSKAQAAELKVGVRTICHEVEKECFKKTKKSIILPKSTVLARANGRQSIKSFNERKAWLTPGEEEVVVDFAIDMALRGFPLNHRRLKEHVDEI
ncbi:hypothetical protein BD414DRAFT_377446, partial [Trametes punicea]